MKLFKLRPLASDLDLARVLHIIKTGEFWFSPFYFLNDPMEGVFSANEINICSNNAIDSKFFDEKQKRAICSFTTEESFEDYYMWSMYANGLRGCAIEIEKDEIVEERFEKRLCMGKITYTDTPAYTDINSILLTKRMQWSYEGEFRLIYQDYNEEKNKFGFNLKLTNVCAIYLGMPYYGLNNTDKIYDTGLFGNYICNCNIIKDFVENINKTRSKNCQIKIYKVFSCRDDGKKCYINTELCSPKKALFSNL